MPSVIGVDGEGIIERVGGGRDVAHGAVTVHRWECVYDCVW